ncbi:MAG: NADH-quinone oxidoreductase subunit H [Lentisphaeria bacterium]|nr:NADH-quinone oxidoreductase subunit H [Lentisphaeria bacterium]
MGHFSYHMLVSAAAVILAPLLPGIINKVKAFFAGRRGPRITQLYYDLAKLLKKECVISTSSGGIIRLAPSLILGFTLPALFLLPVPGTTPVWSFTGDAVMFFYLLGSCRMLMVLAALDTASSFEGMGAAREVFFSALAEAAIFAVLSFLVIFSGRLDLNGMLCGGGVNSWTTLTPVLLAATAMFLVMLAENCRVPFDDPETHLELTMIHEAMILDYAGPDLAAILYASALKLWLFAGFITAMLIPPGIMQWYWEIILYFAGVGTICILVGIVESSMARYRFLKVPPLLIAAAVLPVLAILFCLFFIKGGN